MIDTSPKRDPRLDAWLAELEARLAPPRLRLEPGETVALAAARVIDLEEQRIRSSREEGDLRALKLDAIAAVRRAFDPESDERIAPSRTVARPGDAVYELTMGELERVPLARFADLLQAWATIVEGEGARGKLAPARLREYRRVEVAVVASPDGTRDLVAFFRGTREMVAVFRATAE